MCNVPLKLKLFDARAELIIPHFYCSNTSQTINKQVRNVIEKLLRFIHLLAGGCRGCHLDLGHPLLLSGVVTGLNQQRWHLEPRELKTPGSINYSVGLYPEVRWITAFKAHQTTSATVEKPHCKRQETDGFKLKISPTVKKKPKKKTKN